MTRKRFVKLLMARGFSRNEAVNYARVYLPVAGSYKSLCLIWMIGFSGSHGLAEALNRLFEAAAEAIKGFLSLSDGFCELNLGDETRDEN